MRYSIEPRGSIYVTGYGFLSFAKKIDKNLSNKYSQKIIDTVKKSATDAIKTTSQRTIKKNAEAMGDLVDNKIADKKTSISKKPVKELPTIDEDEDEELTTHKKRYISPKERQQIIDELRLVPEKDAYF